MAHEVGEDVKEVFKQEKKKYIPKKRLGGKRGGNGEGMGRGGEGEKGEGRGERGEGRDLRDGWGLERHELCFRSKLMLFFISPFLFLSFPFPSPFLVSSSLHSLYSLLRQRNIEV